MLTISYHQEFQLLRIRIDVDGYPSEFGPDPFQGLMHDFETVIQIELTNGVPSNDMNISFLLDLHFDNPTKRARAFDGMTLTFKRDQNLRMHGAIPMYFSQWTQNSKYPPEAFAKRLSEELVKGFLSDWTRGKSHIEELTGTSYPPKVDYSGLRA